MSIEVISFIGIFVAAVVFAILCFKGFHIIPCSILGVAILCIMSGMPIYSTLTDTYMASFANFIKGYYLILACGAIFASIMRDAGAIGGIAYRIVRLAYKFPVKYQKVAAVCILPLINFIIVYGGITVYAAVFTLVAIACEIMREMDIHWGYYAVASLGSAKLAQFMPGSAETVNLIPMEYLGTTPSSGVLLGIVAALIMYAFAVGYVFISIRRDEKRGIGFLPAGKAISESELMHIDKDNLPPLWKCLLPLVVMWCVLNIANLPAVIALSCAAMSAIILFYKNIHFKAEIAEGAMKGITSIALLCSVVAFGAVLASTPGYQLAVGLVDKIPGGAAFKIWLTCLILTPILNSSTGGLKVILGSLGNEFLATGIAPGAIHRLACISTLGLNATPHNSGTAVVATVGKMGFKDFYMKMFWTQVVGPTIAGFVVMLLVSAGVYI